jgi:[ribosomal protein S5]-alanine N-acetyltransferase
MHIEQVAPSHIDELVEAIERSRALHEPWVQPPSTRAAWEEQLSFLPESHLRFVVRAAGQSGGLGGVINVSAIIRGRFQNAFLGFYALAPFAGQGLMRAGLQAVIGTAFAEHGLHRLEANVQPGNLRSARLVRGLGFRLEGHSPRYLHIAGAWRDHDRYAITQEDWALPAPAP